ncbi:MAG: anti-sigma factor RsiW [Verrucomicrobiales bacterium]|jgi:anti-sigma factor RsiW
MNSLEKNQERLTRWIDGELAGEELREFEHAAAQDPQLAEAKAEAENLRHLLQADMPARDIPNPEFFNSQIQRSIEEESAPAASASAAPASASGSIVSWFRSPFTLISAAAVAVLGMFALGQNPASVSPDHSSVASTYTPDQTIDASHFYSDEADATVIMLEGLAVLPDSTDLNGQNIVSTAPGAPGELYNEDSQLAFVVIQGADSVPIVRAFQ